MEEVGDGIFFKYAFNKFFSGWILLREKAICHFIFFVRINLPLSDNDRKIRKMKYIAAESLAPITLLRLSEAFIPFYILHKPEAFRPEEIWNPTRTGNKNILKSHF